MGGLGPGPLAPTPLKSGPGLSGTFSTYTDCDCVTKGRLRGRGEAPGEWRRIVSAMGSMLFYISCICVLVNRTISSGSYLR